MHIDESGFALDVSRDYGYSEKGQRCMGVKNWQAKGRVNAIGALLFGVLLTVSLFPCHVDSNVFYQWVVDDLIPKLPEKSVVVMDNASFHMREDVQTAISNAGHILEYLPPYSPDLNPIEQKWAEAKAIRRQYRCDVDTLFKEYVT